MIPSHHSFKLVSSKRPEEVKPQPVPTAPESVTNTADTTESDAKKRSFMKLAGVIGAGAVAATLLPHKAEALVFGSTPTSNVVGVKNAANTRISPATESGNLATVKTNTDPLVTAGGGGYVRQDSTATIAKESGGNLATIAAKDFATQTTLASIKTNSDKFIFSGSNLLVSSSGTSTVSGNVGVLNAASTQINPATEESIIYLRRIVRLMESQGVVDSSNRQRITLDSIASSLTLTTITTVSTVTSVTNIAAIGSYNAVQMFSDVAKNTYANAIRRNLTFS